jgi:hypothetical protein
MESEDLLDTNVFIDTSENTINKPPTDPIIKKRFAKQYEEKKNIVGTKNVLPKDEYNDELLLKHGIKFCDDMSPELSKDRYLREKRHAISIDSRSRNLTTYRVKDGEIYDPDTNTYSDIYRTIPGWSKPNNYYIDFGQVYRSVKSIRLTGAVIPNTDRIVNNGNNDIYFQLAYEGDDDDPLIPGVDQYHIIITPGNYDGTGLAREIASQANAEIQSQSGETIGVNIFGVSFNTKSNVFSITIANNPSTTKDLYFTWTFSVDQTDFTKSVYYMLGFDTNATIDDDGDLVYVQSFSNQVDVGGGKYEIYRNTMLLTEQYIFLCIKNMGTMKDTMGNDDIFAKILFSIPAGNFAFNTFETNAKIYVESPLNELTGFQISFVRPNGELYNFNGLNHTLSFEIIEHADYLESANMNARRGVGDKTSVI